MVDHELIKQRARLELTIQLRDMVAGLGGADRNLLATCISCSRMDPCVGASRR